MAETAAPAMPAMPAMPAAPAPAAPPARPHNFESHQRRLQSIRDVLRNAHQGLMDTVGREWDTGDPPEDSETIILEALNARQQALRELKVLRDTANEAVRAANTVTGAKTNARKAAAARGDQAEDVQTAREEERAAIQGLRTKQRATYYFYHYRRQNQLYDAVVDADQEEWERYPTPLRSGGVAAWPGPRHYHNDRGYIARKFQPVAQAKAPVRFKLKPKARASIVQNALDTASFFRDAQVHLEWVKVLSWGGTGVVMLFLTRPPAAAASAPGQAPNVKYYIVKAVYQIGEEEDDDQNRSNLREEINILGEFEGAEHIILLANLGPTRRDRLDQSMDDHGDEAPMPVMIMEFFKRGSLHDVVTRAAVQGKRIHDRTLWLIFECVFRSLVGMRYRPKSWHPPPAAGADPEIERIPTINQLHLGPRDTCTARDKKYMANEAPNERWVHLDLEPSNFLVGEYTAGHHLIPSVKLNDFGTANEFERYKNKIHGFRPVIPDYNFHEQRRMAKNGWFTPEQFTEEWDYIGEDVPPAGTKIAGQFGWKTNLWQAGQTMWRLISQRQPAYCGPYIEAVTQDPATGRWSAVPPQQVAAAGPNVKWTWGGYMLENSRGPLLFRQTDMDLRELVMRCMMDDPYDRPEMEELQEIIDRKVRGPWTGTQSDAGMRKHKQTEMLFTGPADPPPKPRETLKKWLDEEMEIDVFE
ncbi:kinase-like domain-containing protein [Podospora aff. communis PSN243]|uniref:Kinase-like domain-containing protein n=1 Tax=Podospora aff. communis PSN243 TaxID=3040156 RepID=A0AAV9GC18_9PEZI|nr:kinase-like domain-containing protein [Podospora aff. communis PSN243]